MKNRIELLAPGGDIDSIKAAIAAGADAIYCGLNQFNARNRATNIDFEDLNGILRLAHKNNCQIFLTLNIIFIESEIPTLINLLNKLVNTSIDGVIVQDLGLFYLISKYFKSLKIHASTQLTTHNQGQINFLSDLNATRVNLCRELSIDEIKDLALAGHKKNISTEVFVHGSNCIAFSGLCYISSVHGGKSGNRGRCSQPCRDRYLTTLEGKNFPLNLKDNSAFFDLQELSEAGVDSLKIEGRIKQFDYVYTVVNCWKNHIQSFENKTEPSNNNSDLYKVFNRNFTNSYLKGDINKDMFIDNPMDNSIKQFSKIKDDSTNKKLLQEKIEYYAEKDRINDYVRDKIQQLSVDKAPLKISISGEFGTRLIVSITTPGTTFDIFSESDLSPIKDKDKESDKISGNSLSYNLFFERFKVINSTEYFIKDLELEKLQSGLFIPFKELTSIKKQILYILNGSKEIIAPINVPLLKKTSTSKIKPILSVLISSPEDLHLCEKSSADIFFQLPSSFKNGCFKNGRFKNGCFKSRCSEFIETFENNKQLIPWFPSVLIGKNYTIAVDILKQVQPKLIVTNNTGIAHEACRIGIPWIAGPELNITNSFSLLCLKEKFNCSGSFISNELNQYQIRKITNPDDFKLYYSIFHPILLMTSRQCLHHQVIGCEKDSIDEECMQNCDKSSSITNLKDESLFIEKLKGDYHAIYNNKNFLNTGIITDLPDVFSSFFIDLRDIKTETNMSLDKLKIINLFQNILTGNPDSKNEILQDIHPSTYAQYKKGI